MTDPLPPPPIPAAVDLRNFPDMPLEVDTLRDSDLRRRSTGEEFKAAVILWAACWHQVPGGSLPDDDIELADLAGIGTGKPAQRAWGRVKVMALRGWFKASDGRLYHPAMSRKAAMAWSAKLAQRERTLKARIASLSKMIAAEGDPVKRVAMTGDLQRYMRDLSQSQSQTLSQGLSQSPIDQKGSDRKGSEGIGVGVGGTPAATPIPPEEDLFAGQPPPPPSGHDLRVKTLADLEQVCPGTHIGRNERETWEALLRGYTWEPMLEACRASHDAKTGRIYLSAVKTYLAANFRITEDPHGR